MTQAILDAAPDAMVVADSRGRIVMVNARAVELFGYTREEMLGQAVEMLVPEASREEHERERGRFQASPRLRGMGSGLDLAARRKDGSVFPVDIMLSPLETADGSCVISAIRDVTARRQTEAARRESEQRLNTLFHASPAAICVNTVDTGRVIDVNEQFAQFIGFAREDLVGRTVFEMKLWAQPEARAPVMSRLKAGRSLRNVEARFRRKSGEVRDVLVSCELVELAGENEPVTISMFLDVTGRKQAEESLRQQSEILRRVLDINQNVIFIKDRDSRILMANEATARFYGLAVADILGRRQDELHLERGGDPADLRKWISDDRAVLDSGRQQEWIETGLDREGRLRHYQTRKYPIDFSSTGPAVLVVSVDITDYVEASASSSRHLELARRVVAAAKDLIEVAPHYERFSALARQMAATPDQAAAVEAADAPVREHLEARLRGLLDPLDELPASIAHLLPQGEARRAEAREFRLALQETIRVLHETKRSFKSKVLGQLRERLERLVSQADSFESRPPPDRD